MYLSSHAHYTDGRPANLTRRKEESIYVRQRPESNLDGTPAAGITLPGLDQNTPTTAAGSSQPPPSALAKPSKSNVFVAGILAVDYSCDHQPRSSTTSALEMHTSNPARISQSLGGVGHNVARAASLMGSNVRFCSAVGDDLSGKAALAALSQEGLDSAAVNHICRYAGGQFASTTR